MSDTAQWITLLTVIVGFLFQAYREQRQRRWDKEDRAELAAKVVAEAAKTSRQLAGHAAVLVKKIDENTAISTQALTEANTTNLKIASLGLEHNRIATEQKADDNRREKDAQS